MRQRVLALSGVLLLLLALCWLAAPRFERLRDERNAAAAIRATLVAGEAARQVGNALRLGIPIHRLEGVGELFSQICKRNPGVIAVVFRDASGKTLHRYPAEFTPATELQAGAEVRGTTGVQGRIEVSYTPVSERALWLEIAALVLAATTLGATLARLALRHAIRSGPGIRDRITSLLCKEICNGRFDALPEEQKPRDFDRRPQWLTRKVLGLREKHARLVRIVSSLSATEPSAKGREYLHTLQRNCEAGVEFGKGPLRVVQIDDRRERDGWLMLLLAMSVAVSRFPLAAGEAAGWVLVTSWLALGAGFLLAQRSAAYAKQAIRLDLGGFFLMALLAMLSVRPSFAVLAFSGVVGGYVLAILSESGIDFRQAIIGEVTGLLAGALLTRIVPEAPACVAAAIAVSGLACARRSRSAPRTRMSAEGEDRKPSVVLTASAGIFLGATLSAALWLMRDSGFASFLPLAAIVLSCGWLLDLEPALLPLRGSHFWLSLAAGASASSSITEGPFFAPWALLATGVAGLSFVAWRFRRARGS